MAFSCPFNLQMLRGRLPCPLLVWASTGRRPALLDDRMQSVSTTVEVAVFWENTSPVWPGLRAVATNVRTVPDEGVGMTGELESLPTTFASFILNMAKIPLENSFY